LNRVARERLVGGFGSHSQHKKSFLGELFD
jgi:hypothetical protein